MSDFPLKIFSCSGKTDILISDWYIFGIVKRVGKGCLASYLLGCFIFFVVSYSTRLQMSVELCEMETKSTLKFMFSVCSN